MCGLDLIDRDSATRLLIATATDKGCLTIKFIITRAIDLFFTSWDICERGRNWTKEDRFLVAQMVVDQFFAMEMERVFVESIFTGTYFYNGNNIAKLNPLSVDDKPSRITQIIHRIVRESAKVTELKQLYDYRCCLCDKRIYVSENQWHCEVHHLRPLGEPHNGPDEKANMMVLCPAHHIQFDHGVPIWRQNNVISIGHHEFQMKIKHALAQEHIDYYRRVIQQR